MSERQAFIILAHGAPKQLEILLTCLEDGDFDIYLHMDALAPVGDDELGKLAKRHANLRILPRLSPYWGDYSLVETELAAFRIVLDSGVEYDHIHLLSGQCLPIRSNGEIKEYFRMHKGAEYVQPYPEEKTNLPHVRCWIPLPKYLKYKSGSRVKYRVLKILNQICYALEKIALMPLWNRRGTEFRMGPQWISITPAAAAYLCSREREFRRLYAHAFAPDEFFAATALWNSEFRKDISGEALRYIKWGARHSPHPFTLEMKDYDEMMSSGALFARKFDLIADSEVVDRVVKGIKS